MIASKDLQQSATPAFGSRHASRAPSLRARHYVRDLPRRSCTCRAREKKSVRFAEAAGRGLAAAAVLLNLIPDLLAVSEGRETRAFNGGDVDENILTAIVRLDESKPLVLLNHFTVPVAICVFLVSFAVRLIRRRSLTGFYRDLEIDAANTKNRKAQIDRQKHQHHSYVRAPISICKALVFFDRKISGESRTQECRSFECEWLWVGIKLILGFFRILDDLFGCAIK